MMWVFFIFNQSLFATFLSQSVIRSWYVEVIRSSKKLILKIRVASSTKRIDHSNTSSKYIRNNVRERTQPCGSPMLLVLTD